MHQLASSIVSILMSPFNWIVVLLIGAYFIRKKNWKRAFIILAVCMFIVFGNNWLLNAYIRTWQPKPVSVHSLPVYSCGIVPGGFASPDTEGNGYFNSTADRFIQAVKLYKVGKIKHILISGGNGKTNDSNFREAGWVKGELITFGIPDSVIFIEDKSNNTNDNAKNAKLILDSLQLKPPYLLITSAFHMPRASLLFKNAGLNVVPFPCNYTAGRGKSNFWDLLPNPSALLSWDAYLKEAVGYAWYKLRVRG